MTNKATLPNGEIVPYYLKQDWGFFGTKVSQAGSPLSMLINGSCFNHFATNLRREFGDKLSAKDFEILLCCIQIVICKYVRAEGNLDFNDWYMEPWGY